MKTYRWPGYAIEGGRLFETAGCDDSAEKGIVQRWRKVERVPSAALLALVSQLEEGHESSLTGLPSEGRILEKE